MPNQKNQITSRRSPNPGPQQAGQATGALLSLSRSPGPGHPPKDRVIGEISMTLISLTSRDLPRRDEATESGSGRTMGVGEQSSGSEDTEGSHVSDASIHGVLQLQML